MTYSSCTSIRHCRLVIEVYGIRNPVNKEYNVYNLFLLLYTIVVCMYIVYTERYIMSWWTTVTGLVAVQVPGRTDKEKEYVLDSVLRHLPLIAGSEGPCHTHYVKAYGYTWSNNFDEFGNSSNLLPNQYNMPSKYGNLKGQDKYFVVIEGNLRDRTFEQTIQETCR